MKEFVHLHTHTEHSLLDGMTRVDRLVKRVAALNQRAVAVTDHGSMAGIPSLWASAKDAGVKPIAGLEGYICENRKEKDNGRDAKTPYYHITLLAKNLEGYRNLCRLSSASYLEGFYSKPRIDLEVLSKHNKGLILLSGCVGGWPQTLLLRGQYAEARRVLSQYHDIFRNDFFLEVMRTGEKTQEPVLRGFISESKRMGVKLVATADSHYEEAEDYDDHDTLFCMGIKKLKAEPDRLQFIPRQYHVKSAEEMYRTGLPPESLRNTLLVADMVEKYALPKAGGLPKVDDPYGTLESKAFEGLFTRFSAPSDDYVDRLNYELEVVKELNYENYFIIVADAVAWAVSHNLFIGWGRGSSAGSLLAYCLGITDIDPIKYGLHFERFLNKGRKAPPDVDLDFTDDSRQAVIEYLSQKYGENNVVQIATYGTLGPRQVILDSARVLGYEKESVDLVLKSIPYDPTMDAEDIIKNDGLRSIIELTLDPSIPHYMQKFYGIPRTRSVHAAGIIIDRGGVRGGSLPLMKCKDTVATQYEYEDLEALGYEKFDILGVRTLRVIRDACAMAKIDAHSIPLDSREAYNMICVGNTTGIFQYEGYGYRKFLQQFRPKTFGDIMMCNALYRPGPMQGGKGLELLIKRRFGRAEVEYPHHSLRPILEETYGVMVYQEQVMGVVREVAGWSLVDADLLRHAIGKKKEDEIKALRKRFIKDCTLRHSQAFAESMFNEIEFFSRYGWNKAHAAAYGMVTYVTAYLKANHKEAYMTALMNAEIGDPEYVQQLVSHSAQIGVRVLKPDMNRSTTQFRLVDEGVLQGLGAIKYVGEKAVACILEERKKGTFKDMDDFRARIPRRVINSLAFESMRKNGAFDKKEDFLF